MYEIFVQLCQKKGVSTYQVCKDTGISQGTISNWKNRGNGISGKILKKLADYFEVPMEYIMGTSDFEYDEETHTWKMKHYLNENVFSGIGEKAAEFNYYLSKQAEEYADFLHKNPEYQVLFDASKKVKPEDLQKALKAIGIFTE